MISEISSTYPIVFTIIWQTSLFIMAGLMASYLWKRHPARAHQVLLLSMIAAVAVPFMSIAVKHLDLGIFTAEPKPAAIYAAASEVGIQPYENPLQDSASSVPAESEKTGLPWSEILLAGWTAASVIFLARLFLTFIFGIHVVNKSQPFKYPKIAESMKAAASKLGIKENIVVYSSKSVSSPAIWCWKLKPIVLLPSDKRLFNDKIDLVGILCHELAHVKRRDHVAGLLSELMVALLPWHPLSWLAKKRLLSLSENACDDWVIAAGGCGMNYAESLLDLLPAKQMAFVPAVVRNQYALKRRVMRMLRENYGNPRLGKKWILSSVLITICISLSVAFAQTKSAGPEEKETSEYVPNKGTQGIHIRMNISDSVSQVAPQQVAPQISQEAQFAMEEAQGRFEANLEDLAAAREPLIEFMETHPEDSVPLVMYQMLGQFWYIDQGNERHTEEANRVYATAYEVYPDNEGLLLNYAVSTYELEQFEDAAVLFEKYYQLSENHDIKYLEYAAAAYYTAEELDEAKRVYSELIDSAASPKARWFDSVIYLCQQTEDFENEDYYIHQALDFYPSDNKYKRMLADEPVEGQVNLPSPSMLDGPGSNEVGPESSDVNTGGSVPDLPTADTPPQLLKAFPPEYPDEAKKDNIEGRVVLRFVVDTDGMAKEPEVVSADPPEVMEIFQEAALKAIEQYKFKPATMNGVDVLYVVEMPIAFTLE